jgi:hypothetical protein
MDNDIGHALGQTGDLYSHHSILSTLLSEVTIARNGKMSTWPKGLWDGLEGGFKRRLSLIPEMFNVSEDKEM